jgi:hypothetical protein
MVFFIDAYPIVPDVKRMIAALLIVSYADDRLLAIQSQSIALRV